MPHAHLPRLAPEYYRGFSFVHWSMAIGGRQTGWLNPTFHLRYREVLLHTLVRHHLVCPAYCLMPDHLHLLWLGVAPTACQTKAAQFFRRHLHKALAPTRFQKQAYDHVLTEKERQHDALQAVAHYILENPVRAGLVSEPRDYEFSGCMVSGYPQLSPFDATFWDRFWDVYATRCRASGWMGES